MKFEISTQKAINALEKNLKDHIVELTEANTTWVEKVKEALDSFRDAVDRQGVKVSSEEIINLFYKRPVDTRAQYSKYLGALKLALENDQKTITINEEEYDKIFDDNWEWRISSKLSNSVYLK